MQRELKKKQHNSNELHLSQVFPPWQFSFGNDEVLKKLILIKDDIKSLNLDVMQYYPVYLCSSIF